MPAKVTRTHPIAIRAMSRILWLLPVLLILPALVLVGGDDDAEPMRAAQIGGPDLLQIAERGDVSALDALLKRSADANMRDNCDWTPLMKAAVNGHVEAARRLLDAGAAVDAADKGGYTALLLAASNNHAELVDLLLAHGAMIDAQEQTQGYTPLIWAAHRGHTDTVQVLLQHGADVTLPDFEGHAAAWHAAAQGHGPASALLSGSAAPATAQLGG